MIRCMAIILGSVTLGAGCNSSETCTHTDGSSPSASDAASLGDKRIKITIDHTKISETLSDFPVLLHLAPSSGLNLADLSPVFAELGDDSNATKIAVTAADATTELYVEIEEWDAAGNQAWLWVNVPTVSADVDTVLYFHYDKNRAENTSYVGLTGSAPAMDVWNNGFKAVYHMNDFGSVVADSTRNGHDGEKIGGVLDPVAGAVGPSASFTGANYISIPDQDDFSLVTEGHLIVSAWFSPSKLVMSSSRSDGQIRFLAKSANNEHEWCMNYYNEGSARDQGIAFYWFNADGGLGTGHYAAPYGTADNEIGVGEWQHLVGRGDEDSAVINGTSRSHWVSIYKNGEYRNGQTMNATATITPTNRSAPVTLGHSLSFDSWLEGRMDEVRIDSAPRSDAWMGADYASMTDGLVAYELE